MSSDDWMAAYLNEASSPTDRALIILSLVQIDEALTSLIKLHLRPNRKKTDQDDPLFGTAKPLSGLAPKIEFAYRLGVLDETIRKVLEKLAALRNRAAHRSEPFDFSNGTIQNQIKGLIDFAPKFGANRDMPSIWLKVFTTAFVQSTMHVSTSMSPGAQSGIRRVCALKNNGVGIVVHSYSLVESESGNWVSNEA